MGNQRKVFVVGHKNPDTDSICSAIAYADIKNRSHEKKYVAKRAGQINEETEYVLNRFKVNPPGYISDVGTQVKDMDIRKCPDARSYLSVKNAWTLMKENSVVTLPVRDEEGCLEGIVTVGDIARIFMEMSDSRILSKARTQYRRIAETIEGEIAVGNEHAYFVKGKVNIGAAHPEIMKQHVEIDDLVIMADREEDQKCAIEMGASCIIICLGSKVSGEIKHLAEKHQCVVISSPLDTYTVAALINQSIPIRHIMKKDNLITFSTEDYTDNIKEIMVKNRHRAFPVISKKGKCIGTISRRNFMGMHKKQIILVDHNEKDQAVDNIENAEILEIIDHHRLGSLETIQPVLFRNQPVGCTATILYQIYEENKLEIAPDIAGLLCAAIISDTLMFRSPTCTPMDRQAAEALAQIAGIQIEEHAKNMFQAGSDFKSKSPEEIFYQDFKTFFAAEMEFGVCQISAMSQEELRDVEEKLTPYLERVLSERKLSMVYVMLTNILEESTWLIYQGGNARRIAEGAFHVRQAEGAGGLELRGVVSRKKQFIPAIMISMQEE